MDNDDTQRTIYSLLLTLGFQPTVDGFRYIEESIVLFRSCHLSMRKLCATLGEMHGKTIKAVSRDLSTAIKKAHARGWLTRLNELIGFEFILPDEPVRIKGFIAVRSDFISNKDFMSRVLIERLTDIKSREAYDIAD